ncbi:MAG TPA: solute carrier family 23 protein [Coriobacteriia bacterium]
MAERKVIQTDEKLPFLQALPLSVQHLMAMFGATVLVPYLTGLNPAIGLMTSGVGTILYLLITRGKIPSYLGSSFAFIAPVIVVGGGPGGKNIPAALGGLVVAGFVYILVAGLIKAFGTGWLFKLLPAAVVGAVVIVIGLGLSATAIKMAMFPLADPSKGVNLTGLLVAAFTLAVAISFASYFKGFLATIPVLLGIIAGYVLSAFLGLVNFANVASAAWLDWPWKYFTYPRFELNAILIIAPVALVVIVEHIGHLLVINEITGKDFTPMLPESLAGDGIATALSAAVGGTPSTTYAENIGVMAVTKVYAVQLFWYAGALALLIGGFSPKVGALISSIPTPVMGGVSILLFGLIASAGLRMLVESGIDYGHSRNLVLSSVVLVIGIGMETGGFTIPVGKYTIPGMALATVVGIVLNVLLPPESKTLAAESTADFVNEPAVEAAEEA